jgi:repressor LexA
MVPLTRRQREILDFFRAYSARTGISPTLEEIAESFGVNKVTIFGHVAELERKGVLKRTARGVSRALQLIEDPADSVDSGASSPSPSRMPIVGTIAAGAPLAAIEDAEQIDLNDLVPRGSEVYALRVKGDSMIEDAIRDGDIVLVERRSSARNG